MKTIGIIGAMEEEVACIKSKLEMPSAKNIVGVDFFLGKLHGKNTVVVRSGIGKVNAAICAQVLIDLYGVDGIINVGVAGALHEDLDICDVVISSDLVQHDMDVTSFGYERGVIPRLPISFFPADEELVKIAEDVCKIELMDKKAIVGRIASGDVFVSSDEQKKSIKDSFNACCVEMEGAAIAQTCYLNKIPYIVIRAMSDKASSSANTDFNSFVAAAAEQSSIIVESILKQL